MKPPDGSQRKMRKPALTISLFGVTDRRNGLPLFLYWIALLLIYLAFGLWRAVAHGSPKKIKYLGVVRRSRTTERYFIFDQGKVEKTAGFPIAPPIVHYM